MSPVLGILCALRLSEELRVVVEHRHNESRSLRFELIHRNGDQRIGCAAVADLVNLQIHRAPEAHIAHMLETAVQAVREKVAEEFHEDVAQVEFRPVGIRCGCGHYMRLPEIAVTRANDVICTCGRTYPMRTLAAPHWDMVPT